MGLLAIFSEVISDVTQGIHNFTKFRLDSNKYSGALEHHAYTSKNCHLEIANQMT
jgi:hypothetical protein